jgi:AcrR family transcriptional regulator
MGYDPQVKTRRDPQVKTRRRGAPLEQAILDAAWAELNDVGYAKLTMEAVAARAGTSKPVIYRRWSSRAELVLAAWGRQVPMTYEIPDTGSLRSDLLALFSNAADRVDRMSEMITGVMGEVFRHPGVAAVLRERLKAAPVAEAVTTIVRRAVDRHELLPIRLPPRVIHLPLALIRNESTIHGSPIAESSIAELVDEVYLPLLRGLALRRERRGRAAGPGAAGQSEDDSVHPDNCSVTSSTISR